MIGCGVCARRLSPATPYAIRDRGGVVLVDANVSGQHGAILEALADRLGSAHQIALRTGTEVLGPEQEADVFAGHAQLAAPRPADWERPLFDQTMAHVPAAAPVELDRLLLPGDALDWEVGVELIGAAGHTPGQLAVWIPEHRTLIAADALRGG
jgi:glyoxylase-like metal-dependent hydrolase (beta-lactamase superfamily II)